MPRIAFIVVALFIAASALACATPADTSDTEAGADKESELAGWFLTGSDAKSFRVSLDREVKQSGHSSARLEAVNPMVDGNGRLIQTVAAGPYRGKRIRFSAAVKTESVSGWAGLGMLVNRARGLAAFDNMQNRPIKGTTAWTRYVVVLDVAEDATNIYFGLIQDGMGTSWIDGARVEIVDVSVASTAFDPTPNRLENGGFEAPGDQPAHWFVSGGGHDAVEMSVDRAERRSGTASARLRYRQPASKGYGTLMQSFHADAWRGKRIRVGAMVRGENVGARADVWARVQGPFSPGDGIGLGGGTCKLTGTFDWKACTLVFDVPQDGESIQVGLGLAGPGTLWLDDVEMGEVGPDVALTKSDDRLRELKNGDFEAPGDAPEGWFMSGGGRKTYSAPIDRSVKHGGNASARLESTTSPPEKYGTMMQQFRAVDVLGKRLRMTAFARGRGVTARGDIWLRVQATDSPSDGNGLGGGACELSGTFDWRPCEIVFDVPSRGDRIEIGIGLGGPGTLWLDDVRFEEVGLDVPTSDPSDRRPRSLQNGDFEAPGENVASWFMSATGQKYFTPAVDRAVMHGGLASARLASNVATPNGYGTLMQSVRADDYRCRRVRVHTFSKGEGIAARGDLWVRVQGVGSPPDGPGLGGGSSRLMGTFDWRSQSVVFDVPKDGRSIEVGIGLDGPGTIWIDDVLLEIVGSEVALDDGSPPEPQNLDFER